MHGSASVWDLHPELIDRLKVLHKEGKSFGIMAGLLGHGISRNACISKASRLGLVAKRKPANNGSIPNAVERKKERLNIDRFHPITPYVETIDFTPQQNDLEIPLAQRRTIMTLEKNECRYPVGEPMQPDFFFCGAPQVEDCSYCAYHKSVCFTGAPLKKPYIWR